MNLRLIIMLISLDSAISVGHAQKNLDIESFNSSIKNIDFESDNIVVLGAVHQVKSTSETESFIITQLARKGYKNIFIDAGESEAVILNMYLKSGDVSLLEHTNAREWSGSYKKLFESIYEINTKHSYNISFIGYGFERAFSVGFLFSKWFGDWSFDQLDFKEMSNYLLSIDQLPNESNEEVAFKSQKLKAAMNPVKASVHKNMNAYKGILKENYNDFIDIVFNPIYYTASMNCECVGKMDSLIAGLFLQLEEENERCLHKSIVLASYCDVFTKNKIIPLLADKLSLKYAVINFIFSYRNCEDFSSSSRFFSPIPINKYAAFYSGGDKPVVKFINTIDKIIPSQRENMHTIIAILNNQ